MGRLIAAFVRGARERRPPDHGQALPRPRRHRARQPPAAAPPSTRRPRAARRGRAAAVPQRGRGGRGRGDDSGHIAVPALDPTGTPATLSAPDVDRPAAHASSASTAWSSPTPWRCRACARPGRGRRRSAPCRPAPTSSCCRPIPRSPSRRSCARCARASSPRRASTRRCCASWRRRSGSACTASGAVDPAGAPGGGGAAGGRGAGAGGRAPLDHRRCATRAACCPLRAEEPLRILHLVMSSDRATTFIQGIPEDELADAPRSPRRPSRLGPEVSAETAARVVAHGRAASRTCWPPPSCAWARYRGHRGHGGEPRAAAAARCVAAGRPVILVSFGSPYLLRQVPGGAGLRVRVRRAGVEPARGDGARCSASMLWGGSCRSPCPGSIAYGHGLEIPRREMTLRARRVPRRPASAPTAWPRWTRVIERRGGRARVPGRAWSRWARTARSSTCAPFGRLSYDADAPAVDDGHDLRPGQPDQGHRHHDDGHDPGGRGQARPRQARLRVPARASGRRARTRSRCGTC